MLVSNFSLCLTHLFGNTVLRYVPKALGIILTVESLKSHLLWYEDGRHAAEIFGSFDKNSTKQPDADPDQ